MTGPREQEEPPWYWDEDMVGMSTEELVAKYRENEQTIKYSKGFHLAQLLGDDNLGIEWELDRRGESQVLTSSTD